MEMANFQAPVLALVARHKKQVFTSAIFDTTGLCIDRAALSLKLVNDGSNSYKRTPRIYGATLGSRK